jgi:cysteine-rich repeat protein
MRWLWWVAACSTTACLKSNLVTCADGITCPAGKVCDDAHGGCVTPEQLTACAGAAADAACQTATLAAGVCLDGVCLQPGCGNGVVEANLGEVCDPPSPGHGCSYDCKSNETCGNGVLDSNVGETCDDGNLMSRDGCDSRCQTEQTTWRIVPIAPWTNVTWAYNTVDHTVVVPGNPATWVLDGGAWRFGASLPVSGLGQTYADSAGVVAVVGAAGSLGAFRWDGTAWTQIGSSIATTAYPAAAVYDPVAGRGVVVLGDHKAWAVTATGLQALPDAPSDAVYNCSGAYDHGASQTVILCLGSTAGVTVEWDFDGSTWTTHAQSIYGSLVYDEASGHVVVLANDAQLYERGAGATWSAVASSALPAPCGRGYFFLGNAVYWPLYFDRDANGLVVIPPDHSTCRWNGQWSIDHVFPGPVSGFAAHPSGHGVVVVTSTGEDIDPPVQTWWWNDGWKYIATATSPPERSGTLGVYEPARGEMRIYGGYQDATGCLDACTSYVNDAWAFDGSDWTAVSWLPACSAIYYDPTTTDDVCYSSYQYQPTILTWRLGAHDTDWHASDPLPAPDPAVANANLALLWDASYSALVASYSAPDGLYEQTAGAWKQVDLQPAGVLTAVADPRTGGLVLCNPSSLVCWDMRGSSFSRGPSLPLVPTTARAYAYVPATGQIVVLASYPNGGVLLVRERTSATPLETCNAGEDADGDGLADCADPDCWWACTPACPPYTTCP